MTDKQVIARSKADYRGVTIMETAEGCTFFKDGQRYDFATLSQAITCIETMGLVELPYTPQENYVQ